MSALQLNRLRALCAEWARLSSTPSEAATIDNLANENGVVYNAIFAASSGKEAANQRGAAISQALLKSGTCPKDVAYILSRPSPTAAVKDYTITFLSNSLLETAPTTDAAVAADAPQVKYVRTAGDLPTEGELANFFSVFLSTSAAAGPSAVAAVESEMVYQGKEEAFVTAVNAALKQLSESNSNVVIGRGIKFLNALLTPKYDNDMVLCIRRACAMYSAVFKAYVVPALDTVAESGTALTVGKLRDECSNFLNAANTLPGYDKLSDWKTFSAPIVPQVFRSNPSTSSSDYTATYVDGVAADEAIDAKTSAPVIVRLGVRNREQSVIGARTYFFKDSAPANAEAAVTFACSAQSLVLAALNAAAAENVAAVDGKSAKTVANVCAAALAEISKLPGADAFLPYLVKDFGHVVGPVLTDKRTSITEDASVASLIVRPQTSFYVRILMKDVPAAATAVPFTIEIGDSVVVGMADDLARRAPRGFPECLFLPQGDVARPTKPEANENAASTAGDRRIQTRAQLHGANTGITAEENRINKQAKLWEEKEREFGNAGPKPKSMDAAADLTTMGRIVTGAVQSYSSRAAIEKANLSLSGERIFANAPALTVWLPVEGQPVPFHMATIKEVNIRADGAAGYVCVFVFHTTQESNLAFRSNRSKIFLRELTYRATDSAMFDAVRNAIIVGHESIKDGDKRRQSEKGLLPSSGLGVRGELVAKLPNVHIRPLVFAKISNRGTLEANSKGFRFDFSGGGLAPIEIPYDNVQYCICQHADMGDIQVIFHVVLYKPIQWGKEKAGVKEFQVAAVVLEASEGVSGRRKMTEEEELAQEEADRARVSATNREFLDFSRKINAAGYVKNIFAPHRTCDIDGSLGKGNVRIRGSNKALWQISETPFTTVNFADIEIAFLERMIVGGKTFDLVLVPKNYREKVVMVSSIPMKKADEVKTWLCGADIVYIEIGTNQNYPALFRQFEMDPEWNPWDEQGWRALIEDSDEDADSDDDSSDDSWDGSSEEDDEDDDSDFTDDEDESASSSDASGGDDSDDGSDDWSDMERKAEREDDEAEDDESSDDDRPRKKSRTGNAPLAAGRAGMGGGGRGMMGGRGGGAMARGSAGRR